MRVLDATASHDVVVTDEPYAVVDGETLLARIYAPRRGGPWPALVDVHGGAWTYFDRTIDAHFDTALAARGMVVVALDFRQAPAHRHPQAVADIIAGIRFVRTRAARLRVAPERLGLIGGSTGGHLLLLAALCPDAPEFAGTPWIGRTGAPVDARVAYALPLWPIADPLARYHHLLAHLANPTAPRSRFFDPERLSRRRTIATSPTRPRCTAPACRGCSPRARRSTCRRSGWHTPSATRT